MPVALFRCSFGAVRFTAGRLHKINFTCEITMGRKHYLLMQKIIAVILTVVFLCQPILFGAGVLAEGELTPTPTAEPTQAPETTPEPTTEPQSTPSPSDSEGSGQATEDPSTLNNITPTPTPNSAAAQDTQTTEVINNNQAEVNNDVNSEANTGDNVVGSYEPTATPTNFFEGGQEGITPTEDPQNSVSSSSEPSLTPTLLSTCSEPQPTQTPLENSGEQSNSTAAETESTIPTPTVLPSAPPTPGPVAENIETPDNSSNTALCTSQAETIVTNNNDAVVDNSLTDTASSGGNVAVGETPEIETGDSSVQADLANVVNLNLIGQDFWSEVFNLLGVNNRDLDFSSLDMQQQFNEAILAVLAKNENTGDGSINTATANFLRSIIVSNNNIASVTNTLNLSAVSGQNTGVGGEASVDTGDASVTANLFNLINTNLVGNNYWFGVFNIFGEQNGDIILPYELQFLLSGSEGSMDQVSAVNDDTGEGSQNQALASNSLTTTVNNTNGADVENTVNVLADSGSNTAVGKSGEITTGNAVAKVDIRNFVNTNIFGNRFVFLLINVFGEWKGALLNFWGNTASDGKTVLAVGQLPPVPQPGEDSQIAALNQNTGDNSQNSAQGSTVNSLEVTNNNKADLTNEINGQAISGQNEVYGKNGKIQTGNSSIVANIANFVNTNIIGNNFFFGIINIFGKLTGNIFFSRPDLEVSKTADKSEAALGQVITYVITYKNVGRGWAKDVVIIDILPNGLNFLSASNGGVFENGKVTWKIGKINSGEGGSFTVTASVNGSLTEGTQLANQAAVTTSTDEPNKGNNQSVATTTVKIASLPAGESGGVGGSSADSASSPPSESEGSGQACTLPEVPKAPILVSATKISSTEVKLTWETVNRADYYLIAYGQEPGKYLYGSPNVGKVTSYTVGGLTAGKTYYFAVAAVAGSGNCSAAGPFSNELKSGLGTVLGAEEVLAQEGEIGEAASTQEGEVAGATTPVCPWWWIVLAVDAAALAGFYAFGLRKAISPKLWWISVPGLALLAYLADKFAHNWWIPSQYCQYVPWAGLVVGGIESVAFKFLKKGKK